MKINVYGAGLAGAEAAYQAARHGVDVTLYEMKPLRYTPAHHNPGMAELVCSNSLRSAEVTNAAGLLKAELRSLGSLIMEAADATTVGAGCALAVDREKFSAYVTEKIRSDPHIEVVAKECDSVPDGEITVIATGPLTSDAMADYIANGLGCPGLHFYDAAAPIVDFDSIDMTKAFFASRWGKGDADYINCPMNEAEYRAFYEALITAEEAKLHDFDAALQKEPTVFEGCMPVEVMARRGYETLLYGPMKPVGITHPETGETYHAVVQLRKENNDGTMYNLVGFQTHLTFPEQRRVFGLIPGLENAEFLRYGVMHRNTYLDSPGLLTPYYSMKEKRNIYFAGQMTGVEGYIESCASGFVAGVCAAQRALGIEETEFPRETVMGALAHYVSEGSATGGKFQPMNANFGIVSALDYRVKGGKKARNGEIAKRALDRITALKEEITF